MTMTVNIIGAGKLGKVLGQLLVKQSGVRLLGVCNTSVISTTQAVDFIGAGKVYETIQTLPDADLTFICTPDDKVKEASEQLSQNSGLKSGALVVHCSGVLTSDALLVMRKKQTSIASIHPMRSFADPMIAIQEATGMYCALEGDKEAVLLLDALFKRMGAVTYIIDKQKKPVYHAAGVFASNYLVTLAEQSMQCLQDAGVDRDIAMGAICHLMKGTVENLEKSRSPAQSLTGPIARGDLATITRHLETLPSDKLRQIYALLGVETLNLTTHPESVRQDLFNIFQSIHHE